MKQVIICEKPSTYKIIREAFGTRKGQVCALHGHALTLAEPAEVNPDWRSWDVGILWPGHLYPKREIDDDRHRQKLAEIARHIHDADRVIIATDPDREGDLIGGEIVDHFGFQGDVRRVLFMAMDVESVASFFEHQEPFESYRGRYNAARAREQADKIVNLSLTRTVTKLYVGQDESGVIGVGRVRTPALGILCRREEEIKAFRPTDLFAVEMQACSRKEDRFTLSCDRVPKALEEEHRKPPEGDEDPLSADEVDDSLKGREYLGDRILDGALAERLADTVRGQDFPVDFERQKRSAVPPRLFSLTELTTAAERELGFTPAHTLNTAQSLYETWKITTYPRSEYRYIPQEFIPRAQDILDALLSIDTHSGHAQVFTEPTIRRGKKGAYKDIVKDGANHYAIIPNPNMAEQFAEIYPKLPDDERKLFDVIARSWLAMHAPDYVYNHTKIAVTVPFEGHDWLFRATGQVPIQQGWRAIIARRNESDEQQLPDLEPGEIVSCEDARTRSSKTRPPARYSLGALVTAMRQCWRLVEDPRMIEVLKEADGIGTDATRSSIIETLIEQRQIEKSGKHVIPSSRGMQIYQLLNRTAPNVVDPGRTALWEMVYADIEAGRISVEDGVLKIIKGANREIKNLIANRDESLSLGQTKKPTPKMRQAARKISEKKGMKLPTGCLTRFDVCSAFLKENLPQQNEDGMRKPSEKQVSYARELAKICGEDVPEDALEDAGKCSTLIEELKARPEVANAPRPPSEKQLGFAQKLAQEAGEELPETVTTSMKACSEYIEKMKGNGQGGSQGSASSAPSEKQLSFARSLADEKGMTIPQKALTDRRACSEFIEKAKQKRASA